MNTDPLMDLLRESDPAKGVQVDADRELLGEIMATPPVDPRSLVRLRRARRARQLPSRARLLVPLAGAAAVFAAVAIPVVINQNDVDAPPATAPSTTPGDDASLPVTKVQYTAAVVRTAKTNPRLLLTLPQWKVRSVGGFSATSGEMTFQQGPDRWVQSDIDADGEALNATPLPNPDAASDDIGPGAVGSTVHNEAPQISVDWYPRDQYDAYLTDRMQEPTEPTQVLGQRLDVVAYSGSDHAFMLPPQGRVFLEIRGSHLTRSDFLSLVNEHMRKVSVDDWLAAMPAEVVTAESEKTRLEKVLTGVPTPPGFKGAELGRETALDSYQFGAQVAGTVVCGWIWERARAYAADDGDAVRVAEEALRTSRDWQFLQDMDVEGDYPEVVWEIADQAAFGRVPHGYRGALGCS